nr:hypothetical protein [Tanacetum cinerariifolium]
MFLCALPLEWRAKVMTIEEAKDLATLYLDKLVNKLKEQTSDDRNSQGGSDEYVDKEESKAFNLMARNFYGHFVSECKKPKENKAFIGGAWSDSEDGNKPQNDATCLMPIGSQEVQPNPSISNNDLDIVDLQNRE